MADGSIADLRRLAAIRPRIRLRLPKGPRLEARGADVGVGWMEAGSTDAGLDAAGWMGPGWRGTASMDADADEAGLIGAGSRDAGSDELGWTEVGAGVLERSCEEDALTETLRGLPAWARDVEIVRPSLDDLYSSFQRPGA